DAHPRNALALDQVELHTHGGLGLGRGARELRVALAGVDVAKVEASTGVMDRQEDLVAWRDVTNIEVAAPLPLTVEAGTHLPIGGDTEGADERRDRPGDAIVEADGPVAGGAAGARGVVEDSGGVVARELGPARRFAEWSAAWADRDPRVVIDQDIFNAD